MYHTFCKDEEISKIGLLLILKVAFTYASDETVCLASAATVKPAKCPEDKESWEKASVQKNCTAIKHNCSSFLYHCLLNPWWNETIEVCAPSILVLDGYCSEFNYGPNRIFSTNHGPSCSKFSPPCPSYYNSTEGYKYPGCFRIKEDRENLTTKTPNSSEDLRSSVLPTAEYESQTSPSTDFVPVMQMTTSSPYYSASSIAVIVIGVILPIIIMILIILSICWKMKQQNLSFAKAAKKVLCCCKRENSRSDPGSSVRYSPERETEINNGTNVSSDPLLNRTNELNVSSGDLADLEGLVNGSPQLQDSKENIENTGTDERNSVMCSSEQITESNSNSEGSLEPLLNTTNESNISSRYQADHAGLVNSSPQIQDSNENISTVQTTNTNHPDVGENLPDENNASSLPSNRRDQDDNIDPRISCQPLPNQKCEPKTSLSHTEEEESNFAKSSLPDLPPDSIPIHPNQLQIQHDIMGRLAAESDFESHHESLNMINPCQSVDNTDSHTTQEVSPQMKSSAPVPCTSPGDKESISSHTPSDKKSILHPPFLSSETLPSEGAISNPMGSFSDGYNNHGYNESVHRTPSQFKMPVMVTEENQNDTDQPPIQVENLLEDVEITSMQPPQAKQARNTSRPRLGKTVPDAADDKEQIGGNGLCLNEDCEKLGASVEDRLKKLEDKTDILQEDLEKEKKNNARLKTQLDSTRENLQLALRLMEKAQCEAEKVKAAAEQIQIELEKLKIEAGKAVDENQKAKAEIEKMKLEREKLDIEHKRALHEKDLEILREKTNTFELKQTLSNLEVQYNESQKRVKELEEKLQKGNS